MLVDNNAVAAAARKLHINKIRDTFPMNTNKMKWNEKNSIESNIQKKGMSEKRDETKVNRYEKTTKAIQ